MTLMLAMMVMALVLRVRLSPRLLHHRQPHSSSSSSSEAADGVRLSLVNHTAHRRHHVH